MTATDNRRPLIDRLAQLENERAEALQQLIPVADGDDADRATNVEAQVLLAMIDKQIAAIEQELSAGARVKDPAATDVAQVGDTVTVDFGDGPENFLLASVERAGGELEVITPSSPLGRALVGARAGTEVEFEASRHVLRARLIRVA